MPKGVEQSSFLPEKVFDFEIEATEEPLVARAGLVLPHQMAVALGLPRKIDCELPAPGSSRGYVPSAFVMPILLMLHGGGKALDHLRELGRRSAPRLHGAGRSELAGDLAHEADAKLDHRWRLAPADGSGRARSGRAGAGE